MRHFSIGFKNISALGAMGCLTILAFAQTTGGANAPAPATKEQPMISQAKPGTVIHGFKLLKVEQVKEADSTALTFEHVKSGARLLYMSSKDDNKVFSITFRTIPPNATGVPHVLEHSVLNGSRKFPSKEPFVELIKGSVNTFVNAMTFPDKTVYPVASRNVKDFRNLMDVYLDAVFYPRLLDTADILRQEGWHFEIDPQTGDLTYNGVVYNEMKGAYSSPERVLETQTFHALFPDGTYAHDSGGDPHDIPQLTQNDFVSFYKKYYHPSNSYIYLFGNGNVDADLAFLDSEYLSHFSRAKIDSRIVKQKTFSAAREKIEPYPINPGESPKDKTYFTLNYVAGSATDPQTVLGMDILEYILLESPASPLKRALLDAGVAKSVSGNWETELLQPVFTIKAKGSNPEKKALFEEVVEKTLKSLAKNGINKKLIESSINREEFHLREFEVRGYPKGLVYNFKILGSWIYDGDPLMHIRFEPALAQIKKAATRGYFEKLITKHLINNKHRALVALVPKEGLEQEHSLELKKDLAILKARKTPEQLEQIQAETTQLKKIQEAPDSPEALAKIPLLDLKDLDPKAERLPLVEKELDGTKVLHHPQFTNRITYLNLYFDTTSVPEELLPYLPLLSTVLGKVGTKAHDFQDLSNEINLHTGGISFSHKAFPDKDSSDRYSPRFVIKAKALQDKVPDLTGLLSEILLDTKYGDPKRLKEIVQESRARLESGMASDGMEYAMTRITSYFSMVGKYSELTSGISYYRFVAGLDKDFEKQAGQIAANLAKVAGIVFNRNNLMISISSEETSYEAAKPQLSALIRRLPDQKLSHVSYHLEPSADNEGLIIPSKVQYVSQGADFRKLGFEYTGRLQVLNKIMRTDYLWNRVRVQGGAYGAVIDSGRNGTLVLASYRDPNLRKTLDTYAKAPEYLRGFSAPEREMTKFIIGTVSSLDRPLTPSEKGEVATSYYLSRVSYEDVQKSRDEVLSTKVENIRELAKLFDKTIGENNVCVVGGEAKINEDKDVLRKVVNVLE